MSTEDERNFKIKFCKYIDYLYKISNKSNEFFYCDLIHPRKLFNIVSMLHLRC